MPEMEKKIASGAVAICKSVSKPHFLLEKKNDLRDINLYVYVIELHQQKDQKQSHERN